MQEANNVRSWASILDENARLQAERIARLPVVPMPVALMADAHLGIGAAVGCVVPTQDAILPSAVGVDIGCGVIAVRTSLILQQVKPFSDKILEQLGRSIPAGVNRSRDIASTGRSDKKALDRTRTWLDAHPSPHSLSQRYSMSAWANLGTLGSGNHFIEVSIDPDDSIWVVLHSGSRNIGNALASSHIKAASDIAKSNHLKLEDPDLAYFTSSQDEFHAYIQDMLWLQDYAIENREVMMDIALEILFSLVGKGSELQRVNAHHNFARQETHNGQKVWITRKGAISADVDEWGIIPGSMGTATYIVKGLGNPLSYKSSAHGAGRRLSRGSAKRELTVESLQKYMAGKTWLDKHPTALLDEHPDAYKDISVVMEDQKDLVQPVVKLTQIINYKGA